MILMMKKTRYKEEYDIFAQIEETTIMPVPKVRVTLPRDRCD